MGKVRSQIAVALVCGILGFMLTYQFKMLNKKDLGATSNKSTTDITVEIEQYKKQKEDLEKSINDLQAKIKKYEDSAASSSESTKNLLSELDKTRMLLGETDVKGEGVVIYVNPKLNLMGTNDSGATVTYKDIVYIINELNFAGAEAISVNDIRITPRTGIRNSGNFININEERISPSSRITIRAIGDKNLLMGILNFPDEFSDMKGYADITWDKSDKIEIPKSNKTYTVEFAKPVK